jgi:hypothetical protein
LGFLVTFLVVIATFLGLVPATTSTTLLPSCSRKPFHFVLLLILLFHNDRSCSLKNTYNKPCKLVSTSDSMSVYPYSSYGPTWGLFPLLGVSRFFSSPFVAILSGGGHCITLQSDFTGSSNYCNYYASYRMADTSLGINYDSSTGNTIFAGSYNFSCTDVEVFTPDTTR